MSNRTSRPNIRKRGATYTWYAYITSGDGRRRQISQGGFRTIAEAENDRINKLTELGHGDYVVPDRITVATFLLTEWLPARRIDLEPSTWRSYEQKIRLHVVPHLGGIALQELTPMDLNELYRQLLDTTTLPPATSRKHPPETIERMLELHTGGATAASIAETLRAEGHVSAANLTRHAVAAIIRRQKNNRREAVSPKRELSVRTVAMVHRILSKALNDALHWNRVHRNVAKAATAPKRQHVSRAARETCTADALPNFFTGLGDNRYRYPWSFLATSGARRGEVLGLKWTDIDLDGGTAAMFSQVTTDHEHKSVFKHRHKSGAGHLIHVDPATIRLLREWRTIQDREKAVLGGAYQDEGFVFYLEDGRHYHPERFSREFLRKQQQFNDAHPEAPLPRLTIHGLRHTWATIALTNNVHLKVVSDRLNHSTTDITARVYSHVTRPVAREAANLVGGLILGETEVLIPAPVTVRSPSPP